MNKQGRRKFSAEFKSKVCIEALKEHQSLEALSKKFDIHPVLISNWKKEFLNNSASVFDKGKSSDDLGKDDLIQDCMRRLESRK